MQLTSPDNIVKWTGSDPGSIVQESQSQGDSIQAALNKRERFDYVWPTSAERVAETGMVQGSRGYQVDVKSEWIYDNSNWRLSTSYIVANGSTGAIATATAAGTWNWTVDSSISTDTNFVAFNPTNFVIALPGVYSIEIAGKENASNPVTGQSQLVLSTANTFASVPGRFTNSLFGGALMSTAVKAFFRVTAANTTIYPYFYNDSGANRTMNGTVSVGRIA